MTYYGEDYHRAFDAAASWHAVQKRKGTEIPYISHLLAVSSLVWEDGGDETEAISALLHDAVEDTEATIADVRDQFGDSVAQIVAHCTDADPVDGSSKAPWFDRKVVHINHLRDVAGSEKGASTMRVVGADKLANARSILADHHAGAPGLWGRFKGGLGGTVWYHQEMTANVELALSGSMVARELRNVVDEMVSVMDDLSAGLGDVSERIGAELGDTAISGGLGATRHLSFELARAANADDPEVALMRVLMAWLAQPSTEPTRSDLNASQIELLDAVSQIVSA